MLEATAVFAVLCAIAFFLYTYVAFPALLFVWGRIRGRHPLVEHDPPEWPTVSVTVPAYNEAHQIAQTVEGLLALDYPADRLQILVVSDASTDETDDIVRGFEDRGVELLRVETRRGKGAAENAAAPHLRGEIVVNTDASVRIAPEALKALIRTFEDPEVGLASGCDVSVSRMLEEANRGESGYVGYEMAVRDLETRFESIVGASGCFYAIRSFLHRIPLPESLSRDFAAALHTREAGLRAVSVPDAVCFVPRTASLKDEFRRKVRTITRGMETLAYKRALMNPLRFGAFAWLLFSHKVCRWALPWVALAALIAVGVLAARGSVSAMVLLGIGSLGAAAGAFGWASSSRVKHLPQPISMLAWGLMANVAIMHATIRAARGDDAAQWEPTRRELAPSPEEGTEPQSGSA